MYRRTRGFTLIELLVVIAIIGILAAMLFPVFARARESARKIQCLSNVKNIAMAIQMYLTDYDRFPPDNTDTDWVKIARGKSVTALCGTQGRQIDPWLRWAVVLDEYIKNRDVWRCPSAQRVSLASFIIPNYTSPWNQYLIDNADVWGGGGSICSSSGTGVGNGPCVPGFPPGWGGSITDTIVQLNGCDEPDEVGAFAQSISTAPLYSRTTAEVTDPVRCIVCSDNAAGGSLSEIQAWSMAYVTTNPGCCLGLSDADVERFFGEPSFRKQYSPHMGGVNIGFADGHAKWWDSEAFVTACAQCTCCAPETDYSGSYLRPAPAGGLHGICPTFDM